MLVAKVHGDHARAEQTAAAGVHPHHPHLHPKNLRDTLPRDSPGTDGALSGAQAEAFRAKRDAAAATTPPPCGGVVGIDEIRRKRSSLVAMVKKRVEMLHMNAISREFNQVLVRFFRSLFFCLSCCTQVIHTKSKYFAQQSRG